ncbi:MAG: ATP-dependent zinc metalloprotease FtsH [Desulfonatronovibrio sp.]
MQDPLQKQEQDHQEPGVKNNIAVHFLIFLVVIILVYMLLSPMWQRTQISYSAFLKEVRADNVQEITVQGDSIQGTFKQEVEAGERVLTRFATYLPAMGDDELMPLLRKKEVQVYTEPERSPVFWYLLLSILPLVLIFVLLYSQYRRMQGSGGSGGIFGIGKSQAKRFDQGVQTTTFEDVAGAKEAKVELMEVVDYLKEPRKIKDVGGKVPKGTILVGPPGTGKTLLAKAVAGEARVPFFSITGSDFMEMFVGVGARRVRSLFQDAKQNAPSIIYIDEIDAIGRTRGSGIGGGHDEREQTLNQLLNELDGFETHDKVVVLTSTNRPDILDPALTRPGRFDRRIMVNLPSVKERQELLEIHSRNKTLEKDVDLEKLARETPGFSGADLENLMNEAALIAARNDRKTIRDQDIEIARDKITMGLKRHGLAMVEEEKRVVAYHEAGHAIVGMILPEADEVHKVSIIPRTQAMGATQQFPDQEQHVYRREYLMDKLAVMMGGRCAEDLVFSTATSGAGNDLQQANRMARRMVQEWGMSPEFEHMAPGGSDQEIFLGEEMGKTREYSEQTAREIDKAVEAILKNAHDRAREVLSNNRKALDEVAEVLLEHDEISGQALRKIIEDR